MITHDMITESEIASKKSTTKLNYGPFRRNATTGHIHRSRSILGRQLDRGGQIRTETPVLKHQESYFPIEAW